MIYSIAILWYVFNFLYHYHIESNQKIYNFCLFTTQTIKIERKSIQINLGMVFKNLKAIMRRNRCTSDSEIKRELKNNEGMSFLDLIMPSDIAFVICVVKNARHVWDQTI